MLYDLNIFENTPERLEQILGDACRKRRLEKGWSRTTLAKIADVPAPSIARFENTGKISLDSFLKIIIVFDYFNEMSKILSESKFNTGAELDIINKNKSRRRGR